VFDFVREIGGIGGIVVANTDWEEKPPLDSRIRLPRRSQSFWGITTGIAIRRGAGIRVHGAS